MGWTHVSIAAAVVAPSWLYDDSPPRVSRKIDGIVLTEKGKSRWTPVEYVCISASPHGARSAAPLNPLLLASVSNLKGCQILAGGKAHGRHPRNSSGDKYDPEGVAEPGTDSIYLLCALAFIHREWWSYG